MFFIFIGKVFILSAVVGVQSILNLVKSKLWVIISGSGSGWGVTSSLSPSTLIHLRKREGNLIKPPPHKLNYKVIYVCKFHIILFCFKIKTSSRIH